MGFINNQWLMDAARSTRNRKHSLVAATVTSSFPTQSWDKEHGGVVVLKIERENGDHQDLVLTKDEAENLLPLLIENTALEAWESPILAVLRGLKPQAQLAFLARLRAS